MAGEPNDSRGGARPHETQVAEALPEVDDEVQATIRMHQRIASRLMREGNASRAFSELVRATRTAPLGRRLAASLVSLSLRAGSEAAAVTLLKAGLEENDGSEQVAIRRQLIRLLRRLGELERAREHLVALLHERPNDRRARATLNALYERLQRWEELDAALEVEAREAVGRKSFARAARASLRRARLCQERLHDASRAALRYAQAAQYEEDAGDPEGALNLKLLWLRALKAAQTPPRALQEAADALLKLAKRVNRGDRAMAVVKELGLPTPTGAAPPRRITQQTLIAAADEAEARGKPAEAAALLVAAVQEGSEPKTVQRLEAHYVARGAWRELSVFYADVLARTAEREQRVDYLSKLAELLEDELKDNAGAAKAYGEIVELTGDRRALDEQVRLLRDQEDVSGVRHALDDAISQAKDPAARSQALVARGEAAFARRDIKVARADFDEAVRLQPGSVLARAGLAEVAAHAGDRAPAFAFRDLLARLPRRRAGRAELYRRLARLADAPLNDELLSRAAWREVASESPEDEEANLRLTALARARSELAELEPLLRAQIRREPRSPRTRAARLELVSVLEARGQADEALGELRTAVRFEPGHKEAWLLLAERCTDLGIHPEAAWALEQAATATEDEVERQRTWERLALFCRDVLADPARGKTYADRAEKLKRAIEEGSGEREVPAKEEEGAPAMTLPETPAVSGPAAPPPTSERTPRAEALDLPFEPPPRRSEAQTQEVPQVELPDALPLLIPPAPTLLPDSPADVLELTTGDVVLPEVDLPNVSDWVAPPGRTDERPVTAEVSLEEVSTSNPHGVGLTELFADVRENPLDPACYRQLAERFDADGDASRSGLMMEIADALQGDPDAAPRAPKLMLSALDRAGLRHPALRGEPGQLLGLAGQALVRLYPSKGRQAGSREGFGLDAGRGAKGVAEALLAAVRILGLRSPDVHLSEDNGPPFSLVYVTAPRVLVGRLAVRKELPEAELRFFAGRALFTQHADLLALRTVKREQLGRALIVLGQVLKGGESLTAEGRAVRDALPAKSAARLTELYARVGRDLPLHALMEGARHSANRAGLVVCGGVAPAVAALRAKRSLDEEVAELVRFAASERYLLMRNRRLG